MSPATRGHLHHIELWVPDIDRATRSWGWLLTELGYQPFQDWPGGRSWLLAPTYLVIEQSPAMLPGEHERTRAGLNHLAFQAGDRGHVDALTAAAPTNGWTLMSPTATPTPADPSTTPPTSPTPMDTKSNSSQTTHEQPIHRY